MGCCCYPLDKLHLKKIKYELVLTGFGFFKMRSFEFEQTKRCMWCRKSNFTWHQYIFIRFHLYSLLPHSTFLYKITLLHIVVIHSSKVHCFISFIGTFTLGDLTVHEKWFNCTKNLWIYSSRKLLFSNIYFIDLYIYKLQFYGLEFETLIEVKIRLYHFIHI